MALTLWARLLANDLFIHGIGGAKYDRITDRIIRTFYAVEPPAMACVSATLLLPLPRQPVGDADLTAARRWVRDVVYQPDRWAAGMGEAAALLADRQRAIGRSDELHRLGPRQAHRSERHELWERIRDLNHRVASLRPDIVTDARSSLAFLQQLFERDRVAASREYFFALFPREKLDTLSRSLSLNRIL